MSSKMLRDSGIDRSSIDEGLRTGAIRRVRRGWYRTSNAPAEVIRAVEVGGVLTCSSALKMQGVWTMPEDDVHVRVSRGVAVRGGADVRLHWSDRRQEHRFPIDSVSDALATAIQCLDHRAAIVALDSVLNLKLLTRAEVEAVCTSPRGTRMLAHCDSASQSGLETLARVALRRLRLRVATQVEIVGVGFVDLVVGDRLVIELDGESWHDRPGDFEADRARDRELAARGYAVIRASYRQVMRDWLEIEEQVLRIVRRNGHLWPRRRSKSDAERLLGG